MFTTRNEVKRVLHPLMALVTLLGLVSPPLLATDAGARYLRHPDLQDLSVSPEIPSAHAITRVIWDIVDDHDQGQTDRAIAAWRHVQLPPETVVWRHLALGVAHLHAGRLGAAEEELAVAHRHDPNHAVVHYFNGLLLMERAAAVAEDSEQDQAVRCRLRQEAIRELKLTVKLERSTYLSPTLIPIGRLSHLPYPTTQSLAPPTVDALLHALGADNFVGKTHALLAHLHLMQACPAQAEHHIDEAVAHGIPVPYGYRWVGALYEEKGRSTDARRVVSKAMQGGDQLARPGMTPQETLQRAFELLL